MKKVTDTFAVVRSLVEAGVIRPVRPDKLLRVGDALRRFGATPAAGFAAAAIRRPDETAIIDERGTLTWSEVHRRSNALASALSDAGVVEGDGVAIMCRNHRGYVDITAACSKLGADALYLNTAFAGPQLADVVARENPRAIVFDEEFRGLVEGGTEGRLRFVAWHDEGETPVDPTLDELIARGDRSDVVAPDRAGRVTILTSGTTGTPKGAQRETSGAMGSLASLLSTIPYRSGQTTVIAAPMFHAWGFANFAVALGLGDTVVLRRHFDPEETLGMISDTGASTLVVVPVMLQRMLELAPETLARYDTSSLRVIAASGSAMSGPLSARIMDVFGEVLYNLYGSTEVSFAAIATPQDMRAAPGTVGRPPHGTIVRLFDDADQVVPEGATGRIFVGSEMLFEGYTGGGGKAMIGGLMATGDVGHFDPDGRLFVDGRDDDMIVSGGENVFPQEVEDLLSGHEAVADVAVVGVHDEAFGQRLRAVIVVRAGTSFDADEAKGYVKAHLARYKVPRDIVFVDELPRTSTGKVLKRDLR